MSTEKGVGISVGGAAIGAGVAGVVALAALGVAAAATLAIMKSALDAARDAKERAEIEKRQREIAELQEELAAGRRTAEETLENMKTWRLEAKYKALRTRLHHVEKRVAVSGITLPEKPQQRRPSANANRAELEGEIARLEDSLQQQEEALRKAITGAIEHYVANQGGIDAIDRLAALPPPALETPIDVLRYFEQTEALQGRRRSANAVAGLNESLHRALETLPEHVPHGTLEEIGKQVAEFGSIKEESSAQVAHRRVIELIERARGEAHVIAPLRARLAKAREIAADLVYTRLSDSDQQLLADEESVPDAMEVAGLEERLRKAKASDAARIGDQQRRLALAATLDALQSLGYETSVVDEATWFKNGSMFVSRPEWGGYVVRLTPRDGELFMFPGRYVDEQSWEKAAESLTPEMEQYYRGKIDEWCGVHLPRLAAALKQRDIVFDIHELGDDDVQAIQPVAREEIGDAMADRIEAQIDEQQQRGATGLQARKA